MSKEIPLKASDIPLLKSWFSEQETQLSSDMQRVLGFLVTVAPFLITMLKVPKNALQTFKRLREAMGIIPTSERGASLLDPEKKVMGT